MIIKKNYSLFAAILGLALLGSCDKDKPLDSTTEINSSENFTYSTTQEISVNINLKDHTGKALPGQRVNFFSPDLKKQIASGVSDASGDFNSIIRIPTYMSEVRVKVNYLGFENDKLVAVNGNSLSVNFGGNVSGKRNKTQGVQALTPAGGNWYYMGTYNSQGVPDYLEVPGDVFDANYITDVSNALPENLNIPINKSPFLAPSNAYDVHILDSGDVWVTYLGEGAGQLNTFGYYVYNTVSPPTVAADIDSIYTILPNASNAGGSGGGLNPGDKVYLGKFIGGQSIGWVLMAHGWNPGTQEIKASNPSQTKFYSTYSFNPEGSAALRQHNVQLLDAGRELVIVGFEDVRRDYSSDNDFNDLLLSIRVSPYSSLDISSLPTADYCADDDDGDGVNNCDEDYRFDADRAYDNHYTGTLGFEDLWPGKGDYDFNDLVVEYNTNQVTNADNDVKDIKTTFTVKALGGFLHHGFGVEIDGLTPGQVSSTSGTQSTQSLVTFDAKGLESGQTNAVLIVYDDVFDHVQGVPGEAFINTVPGGTQVADEVFQVDLTLTTAIDPSTIGLPPYDPFMFTNGNRGIEIHMADEDPTDLVTSSAFGTASDDSDPGSGRYYRTSNNQPWVIHIDGSFSYPKEYAPIESAYLNFAAWASSNGSSFSDWYLELPGYRNASNIY